MTCEYGCGNIGVHKTSNGKDCCSPHHSGCPVIRKKMSDSCKESYKNGRLPRRFTDIDLEKSRNTYREKRQTINDSLPFPLKSDRERRRIVLESQGGKCLCGVSSWKGEPLTLHLDHIDGNKQHNKRDNLRYICPNCHSQTETYCQHKK